MTTAEENEKMLKVIEGEPTWQETIQELTPLLIRLTMVDFTLKTIYGGLNNDNKRRKRKNVRCYRRK